MNKKHYHVSVGLEGGYLPDSVYYCKTLHDAIGTAKFEKETSLNCGMTVTGNIRKDRMYICTPEGATKYTLNTLIIISECFGNCNPEDDNAW